MAWRGSAAGPRKGIVPRQAPFATGVFTLLPGIGGRTGPAGPLLHGRDAPDCSRNSPFSLLGARDGPGLPEHEGHGAVGWLIWKASHELRLPDHPPSSCVAGPHTHVADVHRIQEFLGALRGPEHEACR